MNKIFLCGRLSKDPELKELPSGHCVCSFSVATDGKYNKSTQSKDTYFFNVVCWDSSAKYITNYGSKGNSVSIIGTLTTRSYTGQDGTNKTVYEIVADEVQLTGGAKKADGNMAAPNPYEEETVNYDPFG